MCVGEALGALRDDIPRPLNNYCLVVIAKVNVYASLQLRMCFASMLAISESHKFMCNSHSVNHQGSLKTCQADGFQKYVNE